MLGLMRNAVLFLSIGIATTAWAEDRPRVVAVNYPLQYFAVRLLADTAEVSFPVPADVDPSFWRPSIADITLIQSADLILLNGAGFATWIDRVSLPRSRIVNTSAALSDRFIRTESITHSHGDGGEHSHEGTASYLWLDPALAIAQAEAVAAALIKRDLAPDAEIAQRLTALIADLEALSDWTSKAAPGFAETTIIATHPRYQYLARAFGLNILALDWEAGEVPSDAQLAELKGLAERESARVLLWEAEPAAEARNAVSALGISSVTFEPMAQPPKDGDLLSAFGGALSDLSAALSTAQSN